MVVMCHGIDRRLVSGAVVSLQGEEQGSQHAALGDAGVNGAGL